MPDDPRPNPAPSGIDLLVQDHERLRQVLRELDDALQGSNKDRAAAAPRLRHMLRSEFLWHENDEEVFFHPAVMRHATHHKVDVAEHVVNGVRWHDRLDKSTEEVTAIVARWEEDKGRAQPQDATVVGRFVRKMEHHFAFEESGLYRLARDLLDPVADGELHDTLAAVRLARQQQTTASKSRLSA